MSPFKRFMSAGTDGCQYECRITPTELLSLSFSFSAILREEVKYVHTDADLLAMEKTARGKKDIVLGYVRSLGTQGVEKKERMDI